MRDELCKSRTHGKPRHFQYRTREVDQINDGAGFRRRLGSYAQHQFDEPARPEFKTYLNRLPRVALEELNRVTDGLRRLNVHGKGVRGRTSGVHQDGMLSRLDLPSGSTRDDYVIAAVDREVRSSPETRDSGVIGCYPPTNEMPGLIDPLEDDVDIARTYRDTHRTHRRSRCAPHEAQWFLEFIFEFVGDQPSDGSKAQVWEAANHGSDMTEIVAGQAMAMAAGFAGATLEGSALLDFMQFVAIGVIRYAEWAHHEAAEAIPTASLPFRCVGPT